MPQAISYPRETTLNLRIDATLKAEFMAQMEAEDRPASEVLRSLMRGLRGGSAPAPFCRRGPPPVATDRRQRG